MAHIAVGWQGGADREGVILRVDAAILSAHREVEVELLGVKLARLLKGIRIREGVPLLAEEDDVVFFDEVGIAPERISVVRLA